MFHESEFDEFEADGVVDLGAPEHLPFDPPHDYAFEPEFDAPVPRPCPPEVRWGRYATLQKRQIAGLLFSGAALLAVSKLQFIEILSNYLLPLQFIFPLGLILGLCGIVAIVARKYRPGRYRYVIEGEPMIAQIRRLEMQSTAVAKGNATIFHLFTEFIYRDPITGEDHTAFTASEPIGIGQRMILQSTYRVGDYVTAVRLPGKPNDPVRLYGFLGLRHDLGVIPQQGKQLDSPLRMFLTLVFLFAFLGAIGWFIYALGALKTISTPDGDFWKCVGLGAVVFGLPLAFAFHQVLAGWIKRNHVRDFSEVDEFDRPEDPVALSEDELKSYLKSTRMLRLFLIPAALVAGGFFFYTCCLSINALVDTSPAVWKPIQVDQLTITTHRGMVREYDVHYHFLDNPGKRHTRASTPEQMVGLIAGRNYRAEVHAGYFGWPWVRSISQ